MFEAIYVEIDLFCMAILIMIMLRTIFGVGTDNSQRLFIYVIISNIVMFLSDMMWTVVNTNLGSEYVRLNFWVNIIYYSASAICGFTWFYYSETIQNSNILKSLKGRIISFMPLAVMLLLTFTTKKTGWMFFVDENNNYTRGSMYVAMTVVSYGYLVFTGMRAFMKAFDKDNYAQKNRYLSIASYLVFPVLMGTLQVLYMKMPFITVGITMSILMVYMNMQQEYVSIDPLTQLNNRNQLIKYLSHSIKENNDAKGLYLLIMDVDKFKLINDKYGHLEGDRALISIANALKSTCSSKNCFIARYGGDEFIIILRAGGIEEIDEVCESITKNIDEYNKKDGAQYSLSLSTGWAQYGGNVKTVVDLIRIADSRLYRQKKLKAGVSQS